MPSTLPFFFIIFGIRNNSFEAISLKGLDLGSILLMMISNIIVPIVVAGKYSQVLMLECYFCFVIEKLDLELKE